jgi:hypothetical protein
MYILAVVVAIAAGVVLVLYSEPRNQTTWVYAAAALAGFATHLVGAFCIASLAGWMHPAHRAVPVLGLALSTALAGTTVGAIALVGQFKLCEHLGWTGGGGGHGAAFPHPGCARGCRDRSVGWRRCRLLRGEIATPCR